MLLARSGRRGEALNQYAICRRTLAEALDVKPVEEEESKERQLTAP
jgi:DNA-binding SARP family transcriptional activator